MKNGGSSAAARIELNRTPMVISAALVGAGSLIGLAGFIVGGTAVISAARRWLRELEVPPSQVVRQKWGQAKAATTAGATAWHQHDGPQAHIGRVPDRPRSP